MLLLYKFSFHGFQTEDNAPPPGTMGKVWRNIGNGTVGIGWVEAKASYSAQDGPQSKEWTQRSTVPGNHGFRGKWGGVWPQHGGIGGS